MHAFSSFSGSTYPTATIFMAGRSWRASASFRRRPWASPESSAEQPSKGMLLSGELGGKMTSLTICPVMVPFRSSSSGLAETGRSKTMSPSLSGAVVCDPRALA
jgi:hypothetical protein